MARGCAMHEADPKRVAAVAACQLALKHVKMIGGLYDSIVLLTTQLTHGATGGDPRTPLALPEQPIVWVENCAKELEQQSEKLRECINELRAVVSHELTQSLTQTLRANTADDEDEPS